MIQQYSLIADNANHLVDPGFYIVGFICINGTDKDIVITNNRGDTWTCAAGQVLAQNPNSVGYVLSGKSTGVATSGDASITVSDEPVNLAMNTPQRLPTAQTLNANIVNSTVPITVTGTANVNVTNTTPISITGNTSSTISGINAGVTLPVAVSGTANVNITNGSLTTTISGNVNSTITTVNAGVNIQVANTPGGFLAALIPNAIGATVNPSNSTVSVTLTRNSVLITISPSVRQLSRGGLLTVWVNDPTGILFWLIARHTYQLQGTPYYPYQDSRPFAYKFPGNYASGSVIFVNFTGTMPILVGY